ncbi:MAG: hypothetical protein AB7L09_10130 [Nitrospira sp.]
MKTDTYFERRNTRTRGWVRLDRLSGLCTLALVLALTGITSVPAEAFDTHSPQTGTPQVQLVSINRTGTNGGNDSSGTPVLSGDGRFVAFASFASDLVARDTNGTNDVFVRDLQTETTTLVSVNLSGTDSGNGASSTRDRDRIPGVSAPDTPAISADGRFVAFTSWASDLVANDNNEQMDVFVRDLQTGTTILGSVNLAGTGSGTGLSFGLALSADGRFVAFVSDASDLVASDTNGEFDVFVRDLQTGTTTLVSVNTAGTNSGNGSSAYGLGLSANGRFVGFVSYASDLVATAINGVPNVFVRDLNTGITTLVSVNKAGTNSGNGSSGIPVLSADGRFVAFASDASDLVATAINGVPNVFVRDLQTGTTTLVSVNTAGTNSGNGSSEFGHVLSADGRFVVFESRASDLVAKDTNGTNDVFVRNLQTGTTTLVSVNRTGTDSGHDKSGAFSLSADSRFVGFFSEADDIALDTHGIGNAFVRDLQTGTTTLLSVNRFGVEGGNHVSGGAVLSADGRFATFVSSATDLVATNINGEDENVFVAKITSTSLVNDLVTFEPLASTYRTTSDSTGCPSGFVGKFGFDARLTNENSSPPLSDLAVKVKTLSNGNLLQNADGGNGGAGSTLTVPKQSGYADGILSPEESVVVHFSICLKAKKPFTFFVDMLGMH